MSQPYYTYAIGTRRNGAVYLLSEVKEQRIWSKNIDRALVFYTEEEVQYVINKFKIPDCAIARILHRV